MNKTIEKSEGALRSLSLEIASKGWLSKVSLKNLDVKVYAHSSIKLI